MSMSDVGAVLSWWLIIQALGLVVWPLAFRLFRWLPDRGYLFAKPLGLLIVSYLFWLCVSLQLLPNVVVTILVVLAIVILGSAWAYRREKMSPLIWLREHRRLVISYELLFAIALIGWAIFRAHVPDVSTAEKPMEMAFINAIGRSTFFPPQDPWLAGYPIAYYYFGYVILSVFGKLSDVSAGTIFSLGNAFWFALSAASAFAVVADLILLAARKVGSAVVFGTIGAVMLVLMGNLEAPLEVSHALGWGSPQFWTWLDVQDLNRPAPPANGHLAWPLRSDEGWWWRASQLIHDYPAASVSPRLAAVTGLAPDPNTTFEDLIDEFPQFSFLLGDLHPHSMDLSFVLLALGLALNLYQAGRSGETRSHWHIPCWLVYPLVLGGISFMNFWDMPTYGFLMVVAFNLGKWQADRLRVRDLLLELILLVGLSGLLYLPFYRSFTSQVGGLWPNLFNGTRAPQFFLMFGPFIVIGLLFGLQLLIEARRARRLRLRTFGWLSLGGAVALTAVATGAAIALGFIMLRVSDPLREWWLDLMAQLTDRGLTLTDHFLARLSDPWVPLLLAGAIVAIVIIGWANRSTQEQTAHNQLINFILLLFLLGLMLAFVTEFAYIVDIFHSRKNTLFKFYYQAWTLWSVASAYAMYYLLSSPARIRSRVWRMSAGTMMVTFIGLGLLYPALAIPTRLDNPTPPTLDAILGTINSPLYPNARDAYAAAQWLNHNVVGTPILLEASNDDASVRPARSRLSAWTGLPTLVGWYWHETQWRGTDRVQRQRLPDITTIYATTDEDLARALLRQYGVVYILVGDRERKQYPAAGLAKFDRMFPVVFQQGTVKLYRVE
jgi:YYY domain-containing protein